MDQLAPEASILQVLALQLAPARARDSEKEPMVASTKRIV